MRKQVLSPNNCRASRVVLFSVLGLVAVVATFASGQVRAQVADKSAPPAGPPASSALSSNASNASNSSDASNALSSDASKYVGAETCKTCHEEIYNSWEKTPHWKTTLDKEGGPSHQGCEGCHGPGAEHVAGGGDKTKIFVFEGRSRQETSARCLRCHGESHPQSHFAESAHASSDVGCLDCHSPHHAKEKQFLLVQNQPQLCYGCHTSAKADFAKPYHHRVNEGLVQCNDCHNPHGTGTVRQVRTLPSGDCHLLQVPRRQAGTVRLRARAGEDRGLHQLPFAPRFHQSTAAQSEPVNMLCLQCHTFSSSCGEGQSGPHITSREVSGLHHVSHPDSWFQLQRCVFQVGSSRWHRQMVQFLHESSEERSRRSCGIVCVRRRLSCYLTHSLRNLPPRTRLQPSPLNPTARPRRIPDSLLDRSWAIARTR